MKLKRILESMKRIHGPHSSLEICADESGSIEELGLDEGHWFVAFRFDNLPELRAHLGITKKDRCRERLVK